MHQVEASTATSAARRTRASSRRRVRCAPLRSSPAPSRERVLVLAIRAIVLSITSALACIHAPAGRFRRRPAQSARSQIREWGAVSVETWVVGAPLAKQLDEHVTVRRAVQRIGEFRFRHPCCGCRRAAQQLATSSAAEASMADSTVVQASRNAPAFGRVVTGSKAPRSRRPSPAPRPRRPVTTSTRESSTPGVIAETPARHRGRRVHRDRAICC